jgi:hypothetical protein
MRFIKKKRKVFLFETNGGRPAANNETAGGGRFKALYKKRRGVEAYQ